MVAKNFISSSKFDEAKQVTDLAKQQIGALEQDLKRIGETLGGSIDVPVEHHPSYLVALAELEHETVYMVPEARELIEAIRGHENRALE